MAILNRAPRKRGVFLSKSFDKENLLKTVAYDNIKIENVEDMLAGDDDYGTSNRYSPDDRACSG